MFPAEHTHSVTAGGSLIFIMMQGWEFKGGGGYSTAGLGAHNLAATHTHTLTCTRDTYRDDQ